MRDFLSYCISTHSSKFPLLQFALRKYINADLNDVTVFIVPPSFPSTNLGKQDAGDTQPSIGLEGEAEGESIFVSNFIME